MTDTPWLDNKAWRDNYISSSAKYTHWVLLFAALVWNGMTVPVFWNLGEFLQKAAAEPVIFLFFLFPLVGVGLIAAAVHAFIGWRRFGPTPLVLDPFPGAVGGHVGGLLDTRIPYRPAQRFDVNLACLRSQVSGTGKDRKRSESVIWQSEGVCHSRDNGGDTMLSFRFDVPSRLPPSDLEKTGTYYLWRVSVSAALEGPDFSRSYEIPVFRTGAASTLAEGTESHPETVEIASEGLESVADISPVAGGIEAWFPAFQRPGRGIFALLFGATFTGVGIGVGQTRDGGVMLPAIFMLVGTAIALYGLWYLGKSLRVAVTREGVRCRRFLFGYPLRTLQLSRSDFRAFTIAESGSARSGNKTTVYYQVKAQGRDGPSLPMSDRLAGRPEAELLKETYEAYLGQ